MYVQGYKERVPIPTDFYSVGIELKKNIGTWHK